MNGLTKTTFMSSLPIHFKIEIKVNKFDSSSLEGSRLKLRADLQAMEFDKMRSIGIEDLDSKRNVGRIVTGWLLI